MYDSIYKTMVESKVAIELPEKVSFDRDQKITQSTEEQYWLPSKYQVVHPNYMIFVDETGKNTNMKSNGKIGGEQFIVPVQSVTNTGCIGATTNIHFTVLSFKEMQLCVRLFLNQNRMLGRFQLTGNLE